MLKAIQYFISFTHSLIGPEKLLYPMNQSDSNKNNSLLGHARFPAFFILISHWLLVICLFICLAFVVADLRYSNTKSSKFSLSMISIQLFNNKNSNLFLIRCKLTSEYDQMRLTTLCGGLWSDCIEQFTIFFEGDLADAPDFRI